MEMNLNSTKVSNLKVKRKELKSKESFLIK